MDFKEKIALLAKEFRETCDNKLVQIEDIVEKSEELCFHFTDTKNLLTEDNKREILKSGLLPLNNGKNSRVTGREKPAVFFSKGFKGTLGTANRFLINILRAPESEDRKYYETEFPLLFKIYKENKTNTEWIYSVAHEYFKSKTYLVLNLHGVMKEEWNALSDDAKAQVDYIIDDINFENSKRQTIRNMHTIEGRGISADKIRRLNGNAISTLIRMYELFLLAHPNENILQPEEWENKSITCDLITGFIQFEKERLESRDID